MQLGLERFFDMASLAKGIGYAREGRVAELSDLSPDGHLTAEVRGSGRQTYAVDMRLTFGPDLRLSKVTGLCGCPVGVFCKHMVAVLISWQDRVARGSAALPKDVEPAPRQPARPLPYPVKEWLDALTAASRIPSGPASDDPPAVRDRLVYVLGVTAGKPTVTVMKATVQADGRVSERATRYDVERLKRQENRPQFILRKDLEILRDLEAVGVPANAGVHSGHLWRPRFLEDGPPDLLPILRRIAATGRGRWEDRDGPYLHEEGPRRADFVWQGEAGGTQDLRLVCTGTGASLIALPLASPTWLDPATGAFGLLETTMEPGQLHILMRAPKIPAEIAADVAARLTGFSGQSVPVPKAMGIELRQGRDPVPTLRLFGLRGQRKSGEAWRQQKEAVTLPALRLAFDYGGHVAAASSTEALRFREGDTLVTVKRDGMAEAAALQKLEGQGALALDALEYHSFGKQAEMGDRVFVDGEWDPERFDLSEATIPALQFLSEVVPDLKSAGWRVEIDASWPVRLAEGPVQVTARIGNKDAGGLFDFGLMAELGDQQADLAPLVADILAALPPNLTEAKIAAPEFEHLVAATPAYLPMPDGRYAQVDLRQMTDLLRVLLRSLGLMTKLHPGEAGALADLAEALAGCGIPFHGGRELLELGQRLKALNAPAAVTPPAAMRATFRPYQSIGYGWLSALSDTGFGGLLADDMGLGKTLQTLALLAKCHLEGQAQNPSLLIVPTSLARAWARQAAEFVPDLKVLVLQGNDRKKLFDQIDTAHLVVSTYPLLHRDHDILLSRNWELAILDEAQWVKNPASTAAKRIRDITARMRLMEMLEALVQEGRKVLVFSQFVEMLRLIEADVTARGWSYEWLTGDTVDRDGAVTRFQDGPAQIFLISLKAGGVGLTLTAADTVILYDPWWNPAVERQAMDRAHRIGQTEAVFVYRLVAEGTVEEAILGLQARKQALADALFEGRTTEGFAFDQDAIAELFRPLNDAGEGR